MDRSVYRIGFWSGIAAFAATLLYCIFQIFQLTGVLRFPLDEIMIYTASLCISLPFLLEMLCLHYLTGGSKRFFSHAAIIFSTLYAVFVIANYVVQLATVIPSKLSGQSKEVALLDQKPHSMFWDFDALGYIFMGLAMLVAVPVFEKTGFQKWVRSSFLANALVTPLIAFVYFYPVFSERLLFLGFAWGITAPLSMMLLAMLIRRRSNVISRYQF